MPKIIDNIEKKIYDTAFSLFAEKGYNHVTMKVVAEKTGIAVGTLYNYYSNKMDLFLNVFREYINQIYLNINEIIELDGDLRECIVVLYDEIMKISGFSEEIIKNTIINKNNKIINTLRDDLNKKMRELVSKFKTINKDRDFTLSSKKEERVIRLLFLAIIDFAREFPEEREENITFVSNLIKKI